MKDALKIWKRRI